MLAVAAPWLSAAAGDDPAPAGEQYADGMATPRPPALGRFAYAAAELAEGRKLDFAAGAAVFDRLWVSAPSSTRSADGLGPLYNARSCQGCHPRGGRGRAPDDSGRGSSLVLRLSVPPRTGAERRAIAEGRVAAIGEPAYGLQLQDRAIQGLRAEGRLSVRYSPLPVTLSDGTVVTLRRPEYRIATPAYGALDPAVMTSPRLAPAIVGLGLLEMIDEADILANARASSGRPNRVWSLEQGGLAIGRFGWKAAEPTVAQQVQAALAQDIGISSPLFPDGAGDCTSRETTCRAAPDGAEPRTGGVEAPAVLIDALALFVRSLSPPPRPDYADAEVFAGRRTFERSGCAGCHRPHYVTRIDPAWPEGSGRSIWPYTDLLLHDMGEGLADGRPEGEAGGRDWRTAPLWGIGRMQRISPGSGYLHDGRARTLLEAVLWHGGEAGPARDAVIALSARERDELIRFLESL